MKQDKAPVSKTPIVQKKCTPPNCRKLFTVTKNCTCPYCGTVYPRLNGNGQTLQKKQRLIRKNDAKRAAQAKQLSLAKVGKSRPDSSEFAVWLLDSVLRGTTRFQVAREIHKRLPIKRWDAEILVRDSQVILRRFPNTKQGRNQANTLVNCLTARGAAALAGPGNSIPEIAIESLYFSRRTFTSLKRNGFRTLQDIIAKNEEKMTHVRNLGRNGLDEIIWKIGQLEFSLRKSN